jgi:hypothetical protein
MKEFKGDKRTKAYKEWKKNYDAKSKGLGDTVEKITKATGIKKVVKWLAGEDCGCDERQEKLNKLLRYKKAKCLTEEEFIFLDNWYALKTSIVTHKTQRKFIQIYNRVFTTNKKATSCSTCIKEIILDLQKIYNQYL